MINLTIKEIEEWIKDAEKTLPSPTSQDEVYFRLGRMNGLFDILTFLKTKEVQNEIP